MKKTITFLFALVMMLSLAACGGGNEQSSPKSDEWYIEEGLNGQIPVFLSAQESIMDAAITIETVSLENGGYIAEGTFEGKDTDGAEKTGSFSVKGKYNAENHAAPITPSTLNITVDVTFLELSLFTGKYLYKSPTGNEYTIDLAFQQAENGFVETTARSSNCLNVCIDSVNINDIKRTPIGEIRLTGTWGTTEPYELLLSKMTDEKGNENYYVKEQDKNLYSRLSDAEIEKVYCDAINYLEDGQYTKAVETFEKIKGYDYKDTNDLILEAVSLAHYSRENWNLWESYIDISSKKRLSGTDLETMILGDWYDQIGCRTTYAEDGEWIFDTGRNSPLTGTWHIEDTSYLIVEAGKLYYKYSITQFYKNAYVFQDGNNLSLYLLNGAIE